MTENRDSVRSTPSLKPFPPGDLMPVTQAGSGQHTVSLGSRAHNVLQPQLRRAGSRPCAISASLALGPSILKRWLPWFFSHLEIDFPAMKIRRAGMNLETMSSLKPPCFCKLRPACPPQHQVVFSPEQRHGGLSSPSSGDRNCCSVPVPVFTEVWGRSLCPWGEDRHLKLSVGLRTAF